MAPQTLTTNRDIYHPGIDARGGGNVSQNQFTEHSKLLPWLMLSCLVGGTALGVAVSGSIGSSHSETRMETTVQNARVDMRAELERARADMKAEVERAQADVKTEAEHFYRQMQVYTIRVEEAENAAAQVNPRFHPIRQPKEH